MSRQQLKSDPFPKLPSKLKTKSTDVKLPSRIAVAKQTFIHLPQLMDLPVQKREAMFIRKLKLCCKTYTFAETTDLREKDIKLETLTELILYVSEENCVKQLTEMAYIAIVGMLKANIFRTFAPMEHTDYDPEWDEPVQEITWPHLKFVYDLFLNFITSPELNLDYLRNAVDRPFIIRLLEVFNSEDTRERRALRNILLIIYLKFYEQRAFMRKHIRHVFLRYIYETEQFNGIAELLDILHKAINGFHVPIRQEHKDFLNKVLIPLHKPRYLAFYHKQLIECLKGFIKKDENTVEEIIIGLLKVWPKTCSEKEILFLQEIGELSIVISHMQFQRIEESLSKRLARCISSTHYQVAEAALNLWDNVDFLKLAGASLRVIMPIVFPDLFRISREHWNNRIAELAGTLLSGFSEAEPSLYEDLLLEQERKLLRRREKPLNLS